MLGEIVPLSFEKIMQTDTYTMIVLGTKEKKFAIYADPQVGITLQHFLTGTIKKRPLTHDLINAIFKGIEAQVKQVVINDLEDTIYKARLFLEHQCGKITHIIEIDARPSDCITLAMMSNAPVYCSKKVLDKTIAYED